MKPKIGADPLLEFPPLAIDGAVNGAAVEIVLMSGNEVICVTLLGATDVP